MELSLDCPSALLYVSAKLCYRDLEVCKIMRVVPTFFFFTEENFLYRKIFSWVFDCHAMLCLLILEGPVADSSFACKGTSSI